MDCSPCTQLQHLELAGGNVTALGLSACTNIQDLKLTSCGITQLALPVGGFQAPSKLKQLTIDSCQGLHVASLDISPAPALESMKLRNLRKPEGQERAKLNLKLPLRQQRQLSSLEVQLCEDFEVNLGDAPMLQTLCIKECAGVVNINGLCSHEGLQKVSLEGLHLTVDAAERIHFTSVSGIISFSLESLYMKDVLGINSIHAECMGTLKVCFFCLVEMCSQ